MIARCLALLALMPLPALAQERPLTGAEILALLPGIIARGEGTEQTFSASGPTRYVSRGQASTGRWWTTATQYCSNWPPAALEACYDVYLDDTVTPARLVWVGQSGARTVNTLHPRP